MSAAEPTSTPQRRIPPGVWVLGFVLAARLLDRIGKVGLLRRWDPPPSAP